MRVIRLLLTGDEGGGIYSNNQPENTHYLRLDYYVMTPLLLSRWNPYNTGVTCTNRPLTNRGGGGNHGVPCPRFRVYGVYLAPFGYRCPSLSMCSVIRDRNHGLPCPLFRAYGVYLAPFGYRCPPLSMRSVIRDRISLRKVRAR